MGLLPNNFDADPHHHFFNIGAQLPSSATDIRDHKRPLFCFFCLSRSFHLGTGGAAVTLFFWFACPLLTAQDPPPPLPPPAPPPPPPLTSSRKLAGGSLRPSGRGETRYGADRHVPSDSWRNRKKNRTVARTPGLRNETVEQRWYTGRRGTERPTHVAALRWRGSPEIPPPPPP